MNPTKAEKLLVEVLTILDEFDPDQFHVGEIIEVDGKKRCITKITRNGLITKSATEV